jgi:DNA-binding MarR family transcriptional regulator
MPVNASEQDARIFLEHFDALAERLRPKRRPRDAHARECSPRELRALAVLGRQGRVTMSALAEMLDVPLSTATRTVEGLVRKDLVERWQSKADRRIVEVGFGQRGKRINEHVANQRRTQAQTLLGALSGDERVALLRALADVAGAAASRADNAARPEPTEAAVRAATRASRHATLDASTGSPSRDR